MSTAWVFAGHGGQYVGMGRPILRTTEAGGSWLAAAERISGLPLGRLARLGPERALIDPRVLEPLLAAIGGAYVDLLLAEEGPPAAVACYSAGHVAGLYAAGVVDQLTCLQIACRRGAALARVAGEVQGGMVAVHGLPEEQMVWLAEDDSVAPAYVAARNGPMHVVFAGTAEALSHAASRASHAGAVTSPLEVAGPWHSPLLAFAEAEIAAEIALLPFQPARVPVWSTVTALATGDPECLRWALSASVAGAVEWHATVLSMLDAGIDAFVEVSPGRSLWGLLGQIAAPKPFTRRYVECVRGRARNSTRPGGLPVEPSSQPTPAVAAAAASPSQEQEPA